MDYVVATGLIINDLLYTDGREVIGLLGGAGIYGLAGMKLWTDDAVLAAVAGTDFDVFFGPWMNDNNLSRKALTMDHKKCIRLTVRYTPDGRWFHENDDMNEEEISAELERINSPTEKFYESLKNCKGYYHCFRLGENMWDKFIKLDKKYGCKMMWELPTGICKRENLEEIKYNVKRIAMWSLNLPESKSLFGVDSEQEAIKLIKEIGTPCFYRVGTKGAYMIMDGKAWFIGSYDVGVPVDPTGCGNSSTAAAMVAFCEGHSPQMIVAMGNVTAGYNILQKGVYPKTTDKVRREAMEHAVKLATTAVQF